jgi:putative ABC transport system permease protein
LNAGDEGAGATDVVVISDRLWRAQYDADAAIVGRDVRINGTAHTVIGVMPAGFAFPINQDLWLPLRFAGVQPNVGASVDVFGRLHAGVSRERARIEMAAIAQRMARAHPQTHADRRIDVLPFTDIEMDPEMVPVLYIMLLAVSFVLVIACANVANLLLARAATRTRDVAVRIALGASRGTIVLQQLIEACVLAIAGGVAGTLLAFVAVRFFDASTASIIEAFWIDFRVDGTVLIVASALTAAAGVCAGALPALRVSAHAPGSVLADGSRGATGLRIGRIGRALVTAELALACGLMAVSATLVKAALDLRRAELPFDAHAIFTAEAGMYTPEFDDVRRRDVFVTQIEERLGGLPGIEAAALVSTLPGRGSGGWPFTLDAQSNAAPPTTSVMFVTPGLLDVLGAAPLRGRNFTAHDTRSSPAVALVNASWVRRYSSDRDPIGRVIEMERGKPIRIVGVVPDLQINGIDERHTDGIYLAAAQHRIHTGRIIARVSGHALAVTPAVRAAVHEVNPDVPLFEIATLHDAIHADSRVLDTFGTLFAIFGASALFLTIVGLYGVVSFAVTQRTREFGVRIALGARARDVIGLVLWQDGRFVVIGAAIGLLLAVALSRAIGAAIDTITPSGSAVLILVTSALVGTAGVALLVPARRASRLEPVVALRES